MPGRSNQPKRAAASNTNLPVLRSSSTAKLNNTTKPSKVADQLAKLIPDHIKTAAKELLEILEYDANAVQEIEGGRTKTPLEKKAETEKLWRLEHLLIISGVTPTAFEGLLARPTLLKLLAETEIFLLDPHDLRPYPVNADGTYSIDSKSDTITLPDNGNSLPIRIREIEEGSLSPRTYNTPLSVEIQTLIQRHGYAAVSLEVAAHAGQQVATSESSLVQAKAIFKNSKLGKLLQRYKDILESIELPSNGFRTLEQARAAARLSSTYDSLTEEQVKLGFAPTSKDDRVTEARRLRADFYRKQQKALRPTPIRAGRPKKLSVPK